MQEAGFEPATPKRIVPETIALDRSATLAYNTHYYIPINSNKQTNKQKTSFKKQKNKKHYYNNTHEHYFYHNKQINK